MLDTLVIHVPMRAEFCTVVGNLHSVLGDVSYYQVRAVPTYFKRELDGTIKHGDLYHPYESLPTSFSGMAMKFHAVNVANTRPYVSLNASVKILQGHNVYGSDSVKSLAAEMLGLLRSVYPEFFACLDLQQASIARLDSTYSAVLDDEKMVQPCIRFLGNISSGHRRADKDKRDFYNTVYWGGASSRLGGCKVYGKHTELMVEVDALKAQLDKGFVSAEHKLKVFTPELLDWSKCLLRFESTTKRRKLEALNIPTNLWQFIRHQGMDKNLLRRLWDLWFLPVLAAMVGDVELERVDDAGVRLRLCRMFWVQRIKRFERRHFVYSDAYDVYEYGRDALFVVKGSINYTKANRIFGFYQLLRFEGFDAMRGRMPRSTFDDAIRCLRGVGYSLSVLQSLHVDKKDDISFRDLVNIDFTKQSPIGYTPPISSYINDFDVYIRKSGDINYNDGIKI